MVILIVMAPYPWTVHGGLRNIRSSVSMMAGMAWNPLFGFCQQKGRLHQVGTQPVNDDYGGIFIHVWKNGNGHIGRHNQVLINGTKSPIKGAYENGQRRRADREDILDPE